MTKDLTAMGRHELLAELKTLRETGGPCSMCGGTGQKLPGLRCSICESTGYRIQEVLGLYRCLSNTDRAYEEVKRKANDHRLQRDALQAKLDALYKEKP